MIQFRVCVDPTDALPPGKGGTVVPPSNFQFETTKSVVYKGLAAYFPTWERARRACTYVKSRRNCAYSSLNCESYGIGLRCLQYTILLPMSAQLVSIAHRVNRFGRTLALSAHSVPWVNRLRMVCEWFENHLPMSVIYLTSWLHRVTVIATVYPGSFQVFQWFDQQRVTILF